MKGVLKKVTALFLACLMLLSVMPMALAAAVESEEIYPELTVKGFGASSVKIYYEDDPEQKSLFYPFDKDRLLENVEKIDEYIFEAVKNQEPNILRSVIYDYCMETFGMLAYKPDGSNMDGVVTEEPGLRKKRDGIYEFYYDCRESPVVSAHQLQTAIDQLFAETGAEKIELVGSSFGANIVTAYMHEYPQNLHKIDTVLLCAPSVGGMNFLGELLSGNFDISAKGLCDIIDRLSEEEAFTEFFYILEETGVLEVLLQALAVPVLKMAVYEGVVDVARELLATLPTLCVCIPDEYFIPAMKFLYGEDYKDPNHTYAQTIAKMDYYHYNVANNSTQIYLDAEKNNDGLNMAIVCKFGVAAIPLTSGETAMDDGLVTTAVSSFGATCANYNEKFDDDYVQQKYTDYDFMCPEWNIDASTCAFPFRTWFIKGLGHGKKISDYNVFIREITTYDTDVFTDPNRPQFLKVRDDDPQMLEPIVAVEEEPEDLTFFQMLLAFFRKLLIIPKKIIESITKDIDFSIIK
ncbi:MAG: hypothetical protein IKJ27_08390 [Clostridia bacterium]|nr:hypothetical protein [Clostridia bacterium]